MPGGDGPFASLRVTTGFSAALLGAVLFHSEDALRLVRFYKEVLGLEPDFGGEDGAQFSVGDTRIGIWQHSEIRGPARDPDRIILNFRVDDCAEVYETLRSAGVEFIKPPTDEDWGGRVARLATFRDPDGKGRRGPPRELAGSPTTLR